MSTIVTRAGKGSPLSNTEMDSNLTNLNNDKLESANPSTSGTFTHSGDIILSGTGKRITGDFSNATFANRLIFQTSTANNLSIVSSIPNGSGNIAGFSGFNRNDPDNSQYFAIYASPTDIRIVSGYLGTPVSGTYLPTTFYVGGSERFRIGTSGEFGIGGANYGTSGQVFTSNGSGVAPSWQTPASTGAPTGSVFDYVGTTAPTGYVLLSGRTIGSGSSGATERANSDTQTLFELLWNSMTNTEAPVSGGRGASAAADFSANKTITLPDARGRVIAGKDNMGGTTASRLTSGGSGITGTTLGTSGGVQTHTLTAGESGLPSHSHSINGSVYTAGGSTIVGGGGTEAFTGGVIGNAGPSSASSAHQNTQPTLVLNKIIKL